MHGSARCRHHRERQVTERVAHRERLLDTALGFVGASQCDERPHTWGQGLHDAELVADLTEAGECTSGQFVRLDEFRRPQANPGDQRIHHRRRPGISELQRIAPNLDGQRFGLLEASLVEAHVREQAHRPTAAEPVTEQIELLRRRQQARFGEVGVAGQERHPCLMLADPCSAAGVVQPFGETFGLTQEPFGIAERTAEHLGESPLTQ